MVCLFPEFEFSSEVKLLLVLELSLVAKECSKEQLFALDIKNLKTCYESLSKIFCQLKRENCIFRNTTK